MHRDKQKNEGMQKKKGEIEYNLWHNHIVTMNFRP